MKLFAFVFAIVAVSANASTHKLTCKTNVEDKDVTVKFLVSDLFGKNPSLLEYPGRPSEEPVVVSPKSSALNELNDNLGFSVGKKELDITGDADGVFQVGLALYRDSGFTHGFVRAQGDVKFYAKVNCSVQEQ